MNGCCIYFSLACMCSFLAFTVWLPLGAAATIRATVEATRAAEASKARDKAAAEQKMLDSDSTSDGFKAAAAAAAAHKPTAATS